VNDPGCHGHGDWVVWRDLAVVSKPLALPWEPLAKCECFGKGGARVDAVALCLADSDHKVATLRGGERLDLHLRAVALQRIAHPIFGFTLNDRFGTTILQANTFVYDGPNEPMEAQETRTVCFRFALPLLRNGEFTISPAVAEGTQDAHIQHHWVHDAIVVRVLNPHPSRTLGAMVFVDDVVIELE